MEHGLEPTNLTPQSGTSAGAPELLDLSGQTLGDYRLLRRLGQGGMGQVYLAEQLSLQRKVALKIMRADLAASPTALKRFQAEAMAVARVTHGNIVQVYQIGEANGLHYMALEYVEGRTLREFIVKKGPPDLALALSIMRQVAAALQEAHEAGIIHRDIKPENILLTRKGEVKVADFGLSRCFGADLQPLNLTQSGVSMGTPLYMSPEQVQGKEVDPRTDLYSFGVTCYHMLTGQPPFRGQNPFDVAVQHVQNEPVPLWQMRPDLPAELGTIVHRLMAKDPNHRYHVARDLGADLDRLRQGQSGTAIAATPSIQFSQPVAIPQTSTLPMTGLSNPRRVGWAAAVVLSLLLAAAAGAALRLAGNGPAVAKLAPSSELSPGGEAVRIGGPREAVLLAAVRKEPRWNDSDDVRRHLDASVQLGMVYLEQRRLTEAEGFFQELRDRPLGEERKYHVLGKIGQASVRAYHDKAEESVKLFRELEVQKTQFWDKMGGKRWDDIRHLLKGGIRDLQAELSVLNMPLVRRMVAEALDHNAANLGDKLPPDLERLRRLPNPQGRPPGTGWPFPFPGPGKS
jgi:serine/threonine-protein kinase